MKSVVNLMYLRTEVFKGVSKKTNNPFEIVTLFFLDEEMKQQEISVSREAESNHSDLKPMQSYDVTIDIETGQYKKVDMIAFKLAGTRKATA